jgi:AcrR family transcriptional regulator
LFQLSQICLSDNYCLKSGPLMKNSPSPEVIFARQRIVQAAQLVLASKKVSGTRMREIARYAGISQGTLHYYFPSKTGLYLAVLDEMQKYFETRQKQLLSHDLDPAGKIRLFSDQQHQLLVEAPPEEEIFLDFWGHAMVDPDVREKILSMYAAWRRDISLAIEQGVQSGEFDPDQAWVAPYLIVALLEGIALQYLPDKTQMDLEEIFQSVNRLIFDWLRGDHMSAVASATRKPYPSDLSEAQWLQIASLLGSAKVGGRPRTTDVREIVNALLYLSSCDCSWRMLPHDFPGWQKVYAYYRLWRVDGVLEKLSAILEIDLIRKGDDV